MTTTAFPYAVTLTTTGNTNASDSTSHSVTLPTDYQADDLVLIWFVNDGTATASASGWTEIGTGLADSSTARGTLLAKKMVGSEGASVTVTTSAAERAAWCVLRVPWWYGDLTTDSIAISSAASGNNSSPDPPSLNPSGWGTERCLWLSLYGWDGNVAHSSYPTNYSGHTMSNRAANANGCGASMSARYLSAESEDPGTGAIASSEQWVAFTVAIRPRAEATNVIPSHSYGFASTLDQTSHGFYVALAGAPPVEEDELAILLIATSGATPSISGWTQIATSLHGDSTVRLTVLGKILEAGESTVVTVSCDSSSYIAHSGWRFLNHNGSLTSTTVDVAFASGASTTPNPPSLDPSGWGSEATAWIAAAAWRNSSTTPSAIPSGYRGSWRGLSSGTTAGVGAVSGLKTATASSDDPGTFTLSASRDWVAATIAVRTEVPGMIAPAPVVAASAVAAPTVAAFAIVGQYGGQPAYSASGSMQVLNAAPAVGELLIVAIRSQSAHTISLTGWTLLDRTQHEWGNPTVQVFARIAQSGDGTSFAYTASGGTGTAGVISYRIIGHNGTTDGDTVAIAVAQSYSTGGSPDPPNLDPPGWGTEFTLWIATATSEAADGTFTAFPTDYGYTQQSGASSVRSAGAARFLQAGSENPGAFTYSTGGGDAVNHTVAVRGLVSTGATATPAAVAAASSTPAPTAVPGAVTATPSPVSAAAAVAAPTATNALTAAPDPVVAATGVAAPTAQAGTASAQPAPAATTAAVPAPIAVPGAVTAMPAAVSATAAVAAPVALQGAISAHPSPVAAAAGIAAPDAITAGAVLPDPVATSAAVPAPQAIPGAVTASPTPVSATAATAAPAASSVLAALPAPSAATAGVPAPTAVASAVTATPAPVTATAAVAAPTAVGEGAYVDLSPVSAAAAVPAPTAVPGSVTATVAAVSATSSIPAAAAAAGSVAAAPGSVAATSAVPAPAVLFEGSVAPGPVSVASGVPAPTAVPGAVTATPLPVAAMSAVAAPTATHVLRAAPTPVTVSTAVAPPAAVAAPVAMEVGPVLAVAGVPVPSCLVGAVTAALAPVSATASVAAPGAFLGDVVAPNPPLSVAGPTRDLVAAGPTGRVHRAAGVSRHAAIDRGGAG